MKKEREQIIDESGASHKKKNPYYTLLALITAVTLFLLSIQAYFYLIHPEPVNIPILQDISQFLNIARKPFSSHGPDDVRQVVEESQPDIKQIANFIVARSCDEFDRVCQSKALYYFVRDQIRYVPDEKFHDELENPLTVLRTGGADCEDMAVLLIALEKAIGNEVRLVFVPGHAYAQIRIPGYKSEQWINLEGTCKDCQFGELPNDIAIQKKAYVKFES